MINTWIARKIAKPYISRELPGWGRVYEALVGSFDRNADWAHEGPRVIRDKRYGLLRLVDLREWADRSFFFVGRWYDLEAQMLIDAFVEPGSCVVDVGANYGHFTLSAASRTGPDGIVHSFEPNPKSYARLRTHIDMNRISQVRTHQMGVSNEPGVLPLSVPLINSGEATFAGQPHAEATEVTCELVTLDSRDFERKVDFLKIDVEGFELKVLQGAEALLKSDRPFIVTEVLERHLARADATPQDMAAFFQKIGYSAFRMSLQKSGSNYGLTLEKSEGALPDADYLWVPDDGSAGLERLRRAGVTVRAAA